jgi:energy-converting hydrogenase Eha subunit A
MGRLTEGFRSLNALSLTDSMKKLSFVGLACAATIATALVLTPPTIATEQPTLPIAQATNPVTSTQIAMGDEAKGAQTLGVRKPARKSQNPFEIIVGVIVVSLAAVAVIFKRKMGNWTIKQVNKLAVMMNLDPLDPL